MLFTETHEWANIEGDSATIGVTDYAQRELGDIVYVELPVVGASVQAGQEVCVLESTKSAADVYSPLSGTITDINEALRQQPEYVNKGAEGQGWLYKIKLSEPKEAEKLLKLEDYNKLIG